MITYINTKNSYGVETIDELNSKDFNSPKEFKKELNRLLNEYRLIEPKVYSSQRADKDWKRK